MAKSLYQSAVFCFTLAASNGGYSFVVRSNRSGKSFMRQQSQTIQMYIDGIEPLLMDNFKIPMQSNIFSTTSQLASDPLFEAELLNDVSHIVLDFTTFAAPSTSWIRLFNLIGRILIIAADYVPDQYIPPDEAFFQASMLIVSTYMFLKSTYPVIKAASSASLSVRDRRAYKQLFSRVDLSVLQFKALLTSHTLEWVELDQNQNVSLSGDSIYWLHSGDISSSLYNQSTSTKCFGALQLSDRLFGDVLLAKAREESMHKEKTCKKKTKSYSAQGTNDSICANDTLIAGPNGATLLRMSTPKLLNAMDHDDRLSDSISKLILVYMQEKLSQTKLKASNAKM